MSWWNRQCIARRGMLRPNHPTAITIIVAIAIMIGFPLVAFTKGAALDQPAATPVLPSSAARPAAPPSTTPSPTATATARVTRTPEPTQTAMVASPSSRSLPAPTPTPSPTASNTPTVSLFQPAGAVVQRAVSGEDHCIRVSASEAATFPGFVAFQCSEVTAASTDVEITRTFDTPTRGWRYSVDSATGPWQQGSTRTVFTGSMAAYTVYFGPTGTGADTIGQLQVTIATDAPDDVPVSSSLMARLPGKAAAACDPTASITGDAIDFGSSRRGNSGYPASTGTMELTITAAGTGCAGMAPNWSIQVSASAMDGPGDAVIPPSAISYRGSAPNAPPPIGLMAGETQVSLATTDVSTTRIATGSALVESGAIWDVALQVHPPANAPPGIYTGKITIDIASGS